MIILCAVFIGCNTKGSDIIGKWTVLETQEDYQFRYEFFKSLAKTLGESLGHQLPPLTVEFFKDHTCIFWPANGPESWVMLKDNRIKIDSGGHIFIGKVGKGVMALNFWGSEDFEKPWIILKKN